MLYEANLKPPHEKDKVNYVLRWNLDDEANFTNDPRDEWKPYERNTSNIWIFLSKLFWGCYMDICYPFTKYIYFLRLFVYY